MSKEALEAFKKKVESSADLQKDANAHYQKLESDLSDAYNGYFVKIVEIAQGQGLEFTAEEAANQFQAEMVGAASGAELSEDDLEAVAGGVGVARARFNPSALGAFSSAKLGTGRVRFGLPGGSKLAGVT